MGGLFGGTRDKHVDIMNLPMLCVGSIHRGSIVDPSAPFFIVPQPLIHITKDIWFGSCYTADIMVIIIQPTRKIWLCIYTH